jgi:peptide subunit release factor 1 (eRF1)
VGNAHHEHAKEVIERLLQVVRDEGISHIVLAGDQMAIPLLQAEIPAEMLPMLKVLKLDIHASDQDVLTATLAALQEDDAKSEKDKVARLMQQYRAHRLAVLGPDETLQALTNGQVDELLLSGALEEAVPAMPELNGEARPVSLSDQLTEKARHTAATITFIKDSRLLESVGGVGAFLRWGT